MSEDKEGDHESASEVDVKGITLVSTGGSDADDAGDVPSGVFVAEDSGGKSSMKKSTSQSALSGGRLSEKAFQRRVEDFRCGNCNSLETEDGPGYTNHCSQCLVSLISIHRRM